MKITENTKLIHGYTCLNFKSGLHSHDGPVDSLIEFHNRMELKCLYNVLCMGLRFISSFLPFQMFASPQIIFQRTAL